MTLYVIHWYHFWALSPSLSHQISFLMCQLNCPFLLYIALSCPILLYPILIYPFLSCPLLSYAVLCSPFLSYPVLSCSILSYPILIYPYISYFEDCLYSSHDMFYILCSLECLKYESRAPGRR